MFLFKSSRYRNKPMTRQSKKTRNGSTFHWKDTTPNQTEMLIVPRSSSHSIPPFYTIMPTLRLSLGASKPHSAKGVLLVQLGLSQDAPLLQFTLAANIHAPTRSRINEDLWAICRSFRTVLSRWLYSACPAHDIPAVGFREDNLLVSTSLSLWLIRRRQGEHAEHHRDLYRR